MVRLLVLALLVHSSAVNAVDLQDASIGTSVSGAFELAGKLIPLPEGTFRLAAKSISEPAMLEGSIAIPRAKIAHVILVQFRSPGFRAVVHARASLKLESYRGFHWSGRPCKREDTLFRADLTGSNGEDENCLLVDHTTLNLGSRAQGIWKDAADWLVAQGVQLRLPVVIVAHVTRFQGPQLVAASYAFNPRAYGCLAPNSRSWAESPWHKNAISDDPQRVRFVDSVVTWGKLAQNHFDALVAGKTSSVDNGPPIYNCNSARVALTNSP